MLFLWGSCYLRALGLSRREHGILGLFGLLPCTVPILTRIQVLLTQTMFTGWLPVGSCSYQASRCRRLFGSIRAEVRAIRIRTARCGKAGLSLGHGSSPWLGLGSTGDWRRSAGGFSTCSNARASSSSRAAFG